MRSTAELQAVVDAWKASGEKAISDTKGFGRYQFALRKLQGGEWHENVKRYMRDYQRSRRLRLATQKPTLYRPKTVRHQLPPATPILIGH